MLLMATKEIFFFHVSMISVIFLFYILGYAATSYRPKGNRHFGGLQYQCIFLFNALYRHFLLSRMIMISVIFLFQCTWLYYYKLDMYFFTS